MSLRTAVRHALVVVFIPGPRIAHLGFALVYFWMRYIASETIRRSPAVACVRFGKASGDTGIPVPVVPTLPYTRFFFLRARRPFLVCYAFIFYSVSLACFIF